MKRAFILVFCMIFIFVGCNTLQVEERPKQSSLQNEISSGLEEKSPEVKITSPASNTTPTEKMPEKQVDSQIQSHAAVKINPEKLTSKRKTSFEHFNTICFAVVYDDFSTTAAQVRFEGAWQEINAMLTELESKVSVNLADSDICKFNEAKYGESVVISPVTAEVIAKAMEMYKFTKGAYNPAVASLVDLWGFSPRFLNNEAKAMPYDRPRNANGSFDLPESRYIEAFKALSDFSGVQLSRNESGDFLLTKNVKDIEVDGVLYTLKLDLGGIAKGYGADKAAELLVKNGYEYGYVNLGLSSMKLLKRNVSEKGAPDEYMWSINTSNPDNPSETYFTGFGKDVGVSTSGPYEVQYTINGRKYSHIIDPATGEPTESEILSVSIWGGEASYADALSTALCVMGKEKAEAFIRANLEDYCVALIVKTGDQLELFTNMTEGEYLVYECWFAEK